MEVCLKKTIIISAFPGCGKTTMFKKEKELIVLDSDSSNFSWIKDNITLQISVHSLDENRRNELIPYKNKMTLKVILFVFSTFFDYQIYFSDRSESFVVISLYSLVSLGNLLAKGTRLDPTFISPCPASTLVIYES